MGVVVCIYNHRHGEDVWTFDSMASAFQVVATRHISPQLDDVVDTAKRTQIAALIERGEYSRAVDEYNDHMAGSMDLEQFSFYETTVQSAPAVAPSVPSTLSPRCPQCNNEDVEELEITETYTAYHPIRSFTDSGDSGEPELEIENALASRCPSEHFDDGAGDYRVHCRSCLHNGTPAEFRLPATAIWEWT